MVHKKASSISASPALDFLPLPKRTNLNTLSRNYQRDQRKNTVQPIMDCTVSSKLPYAEPPMVFLQKNGYSGENLGNNRLNG